MPSSGSNTNRSTTSQQDGSPSTHRSGRGTRRRIHRSLEGFDEYNIDQPILTSPRSVEACRRQGIEPEELVFRYLESFAEKDLSETVQRMRWEHYEGRRREKLSLVRDDRMQLVEQDWQPGQSTKGLGENLNRNENKSTALEREQRQIEAMKARRQADLDQMIAYELKLQEVQQDRMRQQQLEKQKEEQREIERQERVKEWEALRRERELQKAEEEKRAERERKKLAAEEFRREKKRQELEREEEEQRKREAKLRDIEHQQKREQHRLQTQAILEQQQAMIEVRRKEMEEKDKRRLEAMEMQRLAQIVEHEEQRMRTAMRIADAIEAQKNIVLKRRKDYEKRQHESEQRKLQFEQYRQQQLEEARIRGLQKQQEIVMVLDKMESIEEEKREATMRKEREAAEFMNRVRADRLQEAAEHVEAQRLKQADKLEAVERLKRIEAYKREQAKLKIIRDNERTQALRQAKEEMVEQRRAVKRTSEMLRQKALASFDKLKLQAQKKNGRLSATAGASSSPATRARSSTSA
mmetsp:Transcript_26716/g.61561  ORF Transcript_26716/g.61561 Transcript_26716/m.61561 type:complete len:524 (+) Transcript_26716:53-1624(+)|eukprot:CAMPEP_0114553008 /NCGR_PEP_ID=MMETSP0114-20121206/7426_1 /TAXON_ID=31324 /ORGANISM="Goniomonas sp, Strain m" /LENGTH=523 /DNA_ID=CAMNT_0001737917 /DNA_START=44 /DNA_END=1615 /DNA_ORIENTATION=-